MGDDWGDRGPGSQLARNAEPGEYAGVDVRPAKWHTPPFCRPRANALEMPGLMLVKLRGVLALRDRLRLGAGSGAAAQVRVPNRTGSPSTGVNQLAGYSSTGRPAGMMSYTPPGSACSVLPVAVSM